MFSSSTISIHVHPSQVSWWFAPSHSRIYRLALSNGRCKFQCLNRTREWNICIWWCWADCSFKLGWIIGRAGLNNEELQTCFTIWWFCQCKFHLAPRLWLQIWFDFRFDLGFELSSIFWKCRWTSRHVLSIISARSEGPEMKWYQPCWDLWLNQKSLRAHLEFSVHRACSSSQWLSLWLLRLWIFELKFASYHRRLQLERSRLPRLPSQPRLSGCLWCWWCIVIEHQECPPSIIHNQNLRFLGS